MINNPLYRDLLQKLQSSWNNLPDKPEENPEITLAALWMLAGGTALSAQKIDQDPPELPENVDQQRLSELVDKRLSGEPLAYLTGRQSFMGLEMLAGPGAMIPRRETELLARVALGVLQNFSTQTSEIRMLDLCTGSGNIPLSLAASLTGGRFWGADISPEAVALARLNAAHLGMAERVTFLESDLFTAFDLPDFQTSFDLITCNPPYISSRRVDSMAHEIAGYEPRPAFDGGPFGVSILSRLIKEAPLFLRAGGTLCFEVGLGQGATMKRLMEKAAVYTRVDTFQDEQGEIRVIQGAI